MDKIQRDQVHNSLRKAVSSLAQGGETGDRELAESLVRCLLTCIGEDPDREGLKDTPSRVYRSWSEIYSGYFVDPASVLNVTFGETDGGTGDTSRMYDQVVILKDIEFHSTCEHHMLPFSGVVHIGYIPKDGRVVGVSKLARLVEVFARRLQIQERMTSQIAHAIEDALAPAGVAVVVEAKHLCMGCRGVKKPGSSMVTGMMLGVFRDDPRTRSEFFSNINKG